jgi:hypothetical protein
MTPYKKTSAVNCVIVEGICPVRRFAERFLCAKHEGDTANQWSTLQTTYKRASAVNCPIVDGIEPVNSLLPNFLRVDVESKKRTPSLRERTTE